MPPTTFRRKDCAFCQYYDAKHDVDRCHCAACWRRREHRSEASFSSGTSQPDDATRLDVSPTTVPASPASPMKSATVTAGDARCVHGAAPFHHCRQCMLPPYFQPSPEQWDGHAVVCAPRYMRRDGCGCGARCACRRGRGEGVAGGCGAQSSRPQYAAHEVPAMGPRAALYIGLHK